MKYLKGQLHLHTTMSDGQWTPQQVADGYRENGYDFIVMTDHDTNYDPYKYIEKRDDFLCIPGSERETDGFNEFLAHTSQIHVNALAYLGKFVCPEKTDNISQGLNNYIKAIYDCGALPTVNHPSWSWPDPYAYDYKHLLDVKYPFVLEVKNFCAGNHSVGNMAWENTEYTWDTLLTAGKAVLCDFSDDAHNYAIEVRDMKDSFHTPFNAAVMVKADLSFESIRDSIKNGDFYATTGIELDNYEVSEKGIYVKIKEEENIAYTVTVKGRMGRPLAWGVGGEFEYKFKGIPDEEYVRVKVISNDFKYLMCQPVFQDGHKIVLKI
ncbi:MAG: PHP domain-containing protein [Armatimonadetes bacterium]|nr:PHP domain-containing protein [Candidatus Hippobium faecium]